MMQFYNIDPWFISANYITVKSMWSWCCNKAKYDDLEREKIHHGKAYATYVMYRLLISFGLLINCGLTNKLYVVNKLHVAVIPQKYPQNTLRDCLKKYAIASKYLLTEMLPCDNVNKVVWKRLCRRQQVPIWRKIYRLPRIRRMNLQPSSLTWKAFSYWVGIKIYKEVKTWQK